MSTTPTANPTTPPAPSSPAVTTRPFTSTLVPFGTGRLFPVKVYPSGDRSDIFTDDERAMAAYATHLESQVAELAQRVKALELDVERMEPAYMREAQAKERERERELAELKSRTETVSVSAKVKASR